MRTKIVGLLGVLVLSGCSVTFTYTEETDTLHDTDTSKSFERHHVTVLNELSKGMDITINERDVSLGDEVVTLSTILRDGVICMEYVRDSSIDAQGRPSVTIEQYCGKSAYDTEHIFGSNMRYLIPKGLKSLEWIPASDTDGGHHRLELMLNEGKKQNG